MPAPSVQLSQAVVGTITAPVSTGAGAYLSAAFDLIDYDGVVAVTFNAGALTGSITVPAITQSDTSGGTYSALATDGAFEVTAATVSTVTFSASTAKRFIKFGHTVTTGPILQSITITGFKKYR